MADSYRRAKKNAKQASVKAKKEGRDPYLPALESIVNPTTLFEEPLGVMEIPISMIAGTRTISRRDSFAPNYQPLLDEKSEFASKWNRLYDAQKNEGIRDPILAYEYMHRFYVAEGNKRVSVLESVHSPVVTADVVRLYPVPDNSEEQAVYAEFLEFFSCAPVYDFDFRHLGDYHRMAELLGIDLHHKWSPDQLQKLRAEYWMFTEVYRANVHRGMPFKMEEAFLIYLELYGSGALESWDWKLTKEQVRLIWTTSLKQIIKDPDLLIPVRGIIKKEFERFRKGRK